MASGYFPLDRHEPNAKKLYEAAELIEKVIDDLYDDCREAGRCPEDALADGITIGQLRTAVTACDAAVR